MSSLIVSPKKGSETLKQKPSKLDTIRERELYRYYQPLTSPGGRDSSTASDGYLTPSSADISLTAFAQLCAIRLQASRAMISVIDRETQYFIAEATKTLDLADSQKYEADGDGLWVGCACVSKAGRLCEKTIEIPAAAGTFTITDLSQDAQFNELPFVTGPPHFRFYAGAPLTTSNGINIGSIFILDNMTRKPLTPNQEAFLGTMAQTIMKHLEINREADERKKAMRLSMGMNAFVEGKGRLGRDQINAGSEKLWSDVNDKHPNSRKGSVNSKTVKNGIHLVQEHEALDEQSSGDPQLRPLTPSYDSSQDESDGGSSRKIHQDSGHHMTFARAAHLLCDSLDLHDKGGVVFFDATSRRRRITENASVRPTEVISYCGANTASTSSRNTNSQPFTTIEEEFLHSLLARYPRGKLWSFDGDSSLSSSEEEHLPSEGRCSGKGEEGRKKKYGTRLRRLFPGAQQLLFIGMWDPQSSRWFAGGFAWTTSRRQIFSVETELNFFIAFGNCVMAQIARLASMAADRQKADFIGSISHELRSPLHGILASAEFLADTAQDHFQSSLVDTITSCGRTLLDTINHVLDYSKINSFERNWRRTRSSNGKNKSKTFSPEKEAPQMLNIYATTDVALTTEEVIEGVHAGQIYQDISTFGAPQLFTGAEAEASRRGCQPNQASMMVDKEVEIVLDFEPGDYVFITQPGALKRVIMNVFGNALKYTQKGTIVVELALQDPGLEQNEEESPHEKVLVMKVVDTGKGISREYLRTSLFNPFCQEDPLASGTGLGLSIVRSIVNMLRGSIDIQSAVGVGTEVLIRLPLSRVPGSASGTPPAPAKGHGTMPTECKHMTVALYGFGGKSANLGPVLKRCIEDWFKLQTVFYSIDSDMASADILIIDETDLSTLLDRETFDAPTVVLCKNATRAETASRYKKLSIVECVSKPFGPYKLAKALQMCLDRAKRNNIWITAASSPDISSSPLEDRRPMPDMNRLVIDSDNAMGLVSPEHMYERRTTVVKPTLSDKFNDVGIPDGQGPPLQKNPITTISDRRDTQAKIERYHSSLEATLERAAASALDKDHIPENSRPPAEQRNTLTTNAPHPAPNDIDPRNVDEDGRAGPVVNPNDTTERPIGIPRHQNCQPHLLLVDDNKINLRLLETFMKKRKYKSVNSAEDGQVAVKAAETHEQGYDIIFMDISMPVMNGFEATRTIREMEETRNHKDKVGRPRPPAIIIALTGLASGRDQNEAFTSGIDFFMTKPVSFKEVGQLLDNWEMHGGLKPREESDGSGNNTP